MNLYRKVLVGIVSSFVLTITASSQSYRQMACNNWLNLPSYQSYIQVGDLDIPGTQITVEATFVRTAPYSGPQVYAGDLVSKHNHPTDGNYLLRPNNAEITTTKGYFKTPDICDIELNKTYHVAFTYDGATLKFYRNGFLMSSTPATGTLFQNDFQTRIGLYDALDEQTNLIGYENEVRIWNVVRTQAEIRQYMASSLPSPATQMGLKAYYTFDNLINKQGDPLWNGTLGGAASINQVNPFCTFVADSCLQLSSCDAWLSTPSIGSKMQIGDLDITGNQLTVEAVFNRTQPLNGGLYYGSLVSKHTDALNACYSLLPNGCEITTTVSHYKAIFQDCPIDLNKTYHVAMVYDGATLKFYRNGLLLSYVACTGNIVNNDLITTIGQIAGGMNPSNNQFLGYINEVRIWDVARTQAEISSYMNTSLPSPSTQTGLKAYYSFTDALNKQGNTAWDGSPVGGAVVDMTNPSCGLAASSCLVVEPPPPAELIINDYTPVLGLDQCKNLLNVEDATRFNPGDTVLLIQMQGATITETNSAAFGDVSNYGNAGNYEFNYVKSKSGNQVELLNKITKNYDIPDGKVQLIRVPYYQNYTTTSKLTCLPWDGDKGGVLVFNVANTLDLQQEMDVTGRGFLGGKGINTRFAGTNCFENNYSYDAMSIRAANKGQSIAILDPGVSQGKGASAGGGGGGNDHNSGGGGGGNGGAGGFGGYQYETCGNAPFDNRGIGGKPLLYVSGKVFMGSGGGAGHANNAENSNNPSSGGNGGGIILVSAQNLITHSNKIISNGADAPSYSPTGTTNAHEAMGGGGSGGTVLLNIPNLTGNTSFEMKGGKGGDMTANAPLYGRIGPGGGGGGGVLWTSSAVLSPLITLDVSGGVRGVLLQDGNNPWGTTAGNDGVNYLNLVLPVDNVPFKPNIDSVRIQKTATSCSGFDFKGLGYTNTNPVATWNWDFGDGNTANLQDITHVYGTTGSYDVKLIVADINGCKDSISVKAQTAGGAADFGYEIDVCDPLTVKFSGTGNAAPDTYWNFGDGNILLGVINTVHTYAVAGSYTVQYSTSGVCTDTVKKAISPGIVVDDIILTGDTTLCYGSTKQLRTAPSLDFCWSPITYLDDPSSSQPITSTPEDITYYFTAAVTGNNLIKNGDFSQGNTDFTSQYNYASSNLTEGQYFIGADPQSWNGGLGNCKDHTSGNGNMMMINGSPVPDVNVWKQTVTVSPNTTYVFSTWIEALWEPNPAQLKFSINGQDIGSPITASLPTCSWTQFYTVWNSGSNTTAIISIVNKNILVQGNDFALDDISFAPYFIKRDSVNIIVEKPVVRTNNDTLICSGTGVQLNATGAVQYSWLPPMDLTNAQSADPIATPAGTTQYIVTGTTAAGCTAKDTVNINMYVVPGISITGDTTICKNTPVQLFVGGGLNYAWSPATTLDDASIANPVASPVANTMYHVTITDQHSCQFIDSVDVSVRPDAVFAVNDPAEICEKTTYHLQASGGDQYTWEPASTLNNAAIADPEASPLLTTDYAVTILESVCGESATLSTRITVLSLPATKAFKTNDIDCSYGESHLSAIGGRKFDWAPASTLSNPRIANPTATPLVTTTYTVTGMDSKGCTNSDSVIVKVENINKGGYEMPNAFTPNNDGLNDCYGIKYWGIISRLEFSVYNRWGERIFFTRDPGKCWDGTYKGIKQGPGVFVYMVRAGTNCENEVFRKGTFVLIR